MAGASDTRAYRPRRLARRRTNIIKVGFITPRSGALAAFGEPDPFVLDMVRKAVADGISAGGKTFKVEISTATRNQTRPGRGN